MTIQHLSKYTVAFLLASTAFVFADAKDDVISAAQKLSEAPDYSWTQTIKGGMGASSAGKIQSDGLTYWSATFRDNTVEMYFQGDKGAVKTADGWQSLTDAGQDTGGGPSPAGMAARMAKNLKSPAAMAQDMVDKSSDLKGDHGDYTGNLTEDEATTLLRARRRNGPTPQFSNIKGTISFSTDAGMLTKIEYHITGSMTQNGDSRDIDRTATIEIKDIGRTKIDVPAEAKAKWDGSATTQPAGG